jgi:pimeloyl-ACP methyl ester carboxylesterase
MLRLVTRYALALSVTLTLVACDEFENGEVPGPDDVAPSGSQSGQHDAGKSSIDASLVPTRDASSNDASSDEAPTSDASQTSPDATVAPGVDSGVTDAGTTPVDAAVVVDAGPAPITDKCKKGETTPCGVFVTRAGTEIPLGPYGVILDRNVGQGFKNTPSSSDNTISCRLFASLFGQDEESTNDLLDLQGIDLSLYSVYRPARWVEGETYPIVSWGNGTCAQPEGYGALLRYVASQGFVVVAPNSRYVGSGNEQKRAIDFALAANADEKSPYYKRLDPQRIAAMGHSLGSQGTAAAASDARIKTVILFNGGTTASKPFFGVSGDRDVGNPTPASYETAVNRAAKAAYIFFHKVPGTGNSDGHLTLMREPLRVTEPTVHWLKLLLSNDAASKEWFVGASCKLCNRDADFEFGQKGL